MLATNSLVNEQGEMTGSFALEHRKLNGLLIAKKGVSRHAHDVGWVVNSLDNSCEGSADMRRVSDVQIDANETQKQGEEMIMLIMSRYSPKEC